MPYARALDAIRAKVDRGARVLYGEAIWSAAPTVLAMANLGGSSDEHLMLADLADLVAAAGFMPMAIHEASQAEWDEFESGYSAGYARWLAEHEPDHPDAAEVRERAASQRAGYLRGYRGVLGMAYFELVAV